MAEVLVLVDHVDGDVRKSTAELLTAAARLGEPSAVFVGAGAQQAAETLGRYGATKVYAVESAEVTDHLVAPVAEVLAVLVRDHSPAAVLLPSDNDGKEIAGRLAIKTSSGIVVDAVDVTPADGGVQTTQSVFAGSYTVTSVVTQGSPVITLKPNSIRCRRPRAPRPPSRLRRAWSRPLRWRRRPRP